MKISVIICAYTEDRWVDLCEAIESLCQQTRIPDEIVLVIDHNEALYKRVLENFANVTVIRNTEPRGLSGARNSGLKQATGDIIAFMDEDAAAEFNWLEKLLEHYQDSAIVGVGGGIIPNWLENTPRWLPEEFYWVVGCTYKGMPEQPSIVRNLIGCNMSFRQQTFADVGVFRSGIGRIGTLPVGCEETELCIRINQNKSKACLLYDPSARVLHRVPPTRTTLRYFVTRCYSEGISKAVISRFVGVDDSLSNERSYVRKTLPSGFVRGLTDAIKGDVMGVFRSSLILIGLVCTGFGYAIGSIQGAATQTKSTE